MTQRFAATIYPRGTQAITYTYAPGDIIIALFVTAIKIKSHNFPAQGVKPNVNLFKH